MKLNFFTAGLIGLTGAQTGPNESVCPTGTTGDGVTCVDDNECDLGTHDCHATRACLNVWESFRCICGNGTMADGDECVDDDECATGQHDCTTNEDCRNVWSSYECVDITTTQSTTTAPTTETIATTETTASSETTATTVTTAINGTTATTTTTLNTATPTTAACECTCPTVINPVDDPKITTTPRWTGDVTYSVGTTSNSIISFVSGLLISIILSI